MAYVISGYDSEAIHGQVLRVSSREDTTSLGTSREMKKMCDYGGAERWLAGTGVVRVEL